MKVIPLEDRVLIKTAELEEKTKSGLFIPQTAQEKTQVGVVTAVGSDKEEIKVKVGQKIMYDKYAGTSIKVDGAEYLIIKSPLVYKGWTLHCCYYSWRSCIPLCKLW